MDMIIVFSFSEDVSLCAVPLQVFVLPRVGRTGGEWEPRRRRDAMSGSGYPARRVFEPVSWVATVSTDEAGHTLTGGPDEVRP